MLFFLRQTLETRRLFLIELGLIWFGLIVFGVWLAIWNPLDRPGAFVWTGRVPEWAWSTLFLANGGWWMFGISASVGWKRPWGIYHSFGAALLSGVLWSAFLCDFAFFSRHTAGVPLFGMPWSASVFLAFRLRVVLHRTRKRRESVDANAAT
jgi:hypothetical protein